ncbi:NADAR family protein [Paucibacter sp. O1-1]|nr:NADAR family protein [Paucibacter sp. O1-1]MDA3829868.1 NADAR family protein [Paucibacter sp. O1-1]
MEEIKFYRANEEPYGRFSNLFKRPIEFEGEIFETSEHAYQAGKARKPQVREWILAAPSPALVAMAAHGLYWWDIRSDWSKIKFDRMRDVLRAKFSQHEDLRELLLSTGNARLVEAATVDNTVNRTWGEVKGVGKNMLGKLLMEVREELRAAAPKRAKKVATKATITKAETKPVAKAPAKPAGRVRKTSTVAQAAA